MTLHSEESNRSRAGVIFACHAWYHDQVGGSFKIATELAEYLVRSGRRVYYVCGTDDRRPVNPTMEKGVEIWRYPYPQAKSPHPSNVMGHVWATRRLTRLILRREPDASINGHTPLQFLGAVLAARGGRNWRVASVHSPLRQELESNWDGPGGPTRWLAAWTAEAIDRSAVRRADKILCESQFTCRILTEEFGDRVATKTDVVPGWVDTERFQPVAHVSAVRQQLGDAWPTEVPIFFTVRRLETRMGLDQLVRAAAILRGRGGDFRVLIGGSGPLRDTLQRQIQESGLHGIVHLLGRISDEQLPLCYAAADCFVLPTRALECFGLIVLEAYACGTPVIGTPVGAIPELVSQQGDGWLAHGTDAQDIADRMAAFLRGELLADRSKLRAIAEQYSAEVGLRRMAGLLVPERSL
jgi:glycosyltransferase involved in cell wall biosynthesis